MTILSDLLQGNNAEAATGARPDDTVVLIWDGEGSAYMVNPSRRLIDDLILSGHVVRYLQGTPPARIET